MTQHYSSQYPQKETLSYDVVIVGGGPAGLAAAIKLKQLGSQSNKEISVCVLEKGSEMGSHILSGALFDPIALTELLPKWQEMDAPLNLQVKKDLFLFLGKQHSYSLPNYLIPSCFKNSGNYIISLANLVRWLAQQAEKLGVDLFPGFPASEILYNEKNDVIGVATNSLGLKANGEPGEQFQAGVKLLGKYTLFAEGARGELTKQLEKKFNLRGQNSSQTFSIGFKEIWEVDPQQYKPGLVMHTAGWPLNQSTYGGSFLYHMDKNQIAIGMVIGLDYTNPYFSPFEEFQRYKTHNKVAHFLNGGKRIAYGARAIATGGLTSLPNLIFPGGALLGCGAGFLNTSRIKGSHTAIKSGILAAEAVHEALVDQRKQDLLTHYPDKFKNSWLYQELYQSRNFKQWMRKGLYIGTLMTAIEQILFKKRIFWTLRHHLPDHQTLKKAKECTTIHYPKPDGKLSFDRTSSIHLSRIKHKSDQPIHLKLINKDSPVEINLKQYDGIEARYCPAGVYEFHKNEKGKYFLKINAQNCIHCKTCDIKDPSQNIVWTSPEGGSGPNYTNM